jgi:hypothetical protein
MMPRLQELLVIPVKPGWSRLIANFPRSFPFLPAPANALLWLKTIAVVDHQTRNAVLDGGCRRG